MDEFAAIARFFAPLAASPGARGLLDDVGLLALPGAGGPLIVTTDAVVEGVHFLPDDPLDDVACKAIRVNVSDVAAKGGRPMAFTLALAWPQNRPAAEMEALARGLQGDIARYDLALLGGDTVSTPGPLTLCVTLIAAPYGARVPARADAEAGDDVWVTGTIGDAGLGLRLARGEAGIPRDPALLNAYRRPDPPLEAAPLIARFARASMDVSDGLAGDIEKLAAASGKAITLELAGLPLSPAAALWVQAQADPWAARAWLSGAGDDYQALFTAAPGDRAAIEAQAPCRLTRLGSVREGAGVRLLTPHGDAAPSSYRHTLGGANGT